MYIYLTGFKIEVQGTFRITKTCRLKFHTNSYQMYQTFNLTRQTCVSST